MATISGKRFQITDGASTPTNLFPYTVTEAVYGLSTVIEAAKTAVTNSLTAVTLNGVSKAGTTASFYAPAASGTTGQILKATTSGAPVWTSAALGASNKPIYLNSSGVLTEGVACLPLSAGSSYPLTDNLHITGGQGRVVLSGVVQYNPTSSDTRLLGPYGTDYPLCWYDGGAWRTVYHSGNSNGSSFPWACSTLTANNEIYITPIARNANNGTIWFMDTVAANTPRNGLKIVSEYADTRSRQDLVVYTSNNATSPYTPTWVDSFHIKYTGNVGIGTNAPTTKLDVRGAITIYAADNPGFIIKRNASSGAANMMLLPDNQEVYGWLIGAQNNTNGRRLAFIYRDTTDTELASIANNGAFTCRGIYVNADASATATGIALWGVNSLTTYGIYMATTANYGTHGGVTSSGAYATYFQMNNTAGRGWIWRAASTCVASINVAGLFTTNGDQVVSSDASLKTNLKDVTYSVEDIAACRAVTFDWKDGRGHSAGSIAQDWKPLIPELVHGEEGSMTLAYGQIALINTIIIARHENEQDKEIRRLKARVEDLEKQLKIRS